MVMALNGDGSLYQVKDPKNPGKMLWQASSTVSYTAPGKVIRITGTAKTRTEAIARRNKNVLRYYAKREDYGQAAEAVRDTDMNLTHSRLCYKWLDYIKGEVGEAT